MHGGRAIASGRYVEVVPHSRIVFTWGWEDEGNAVPPGTTTIDVTLTPAGEGTLLRLTHRDLPTAEMRERHGEGWTHYLARLALAAAGQDPGPDPWGRPCAPGEPDDRQLSGGNRPPARIRMSLRHPRKEPRNDKPSDPL